MHHRFGTAGVVAFCWIAILPATAVAQDYRIERIASGLSQPTYVTQAPGDPANILYFTERTSNTIAGFSANNQMGKVWRYDVNTRAKTAVLDLSVRRVVNDEGLQTIAFGPDFNTPGSPTYRKMYVSSSEFPGIAQAARNRVEEYTMNPDGTFGSPRVILQYNNNRDHNHTVNWVGFDPNATGAARNYLYISTGDGSFGNPYGGGNSPGGRPSQNPNDVQGKLLRVDITGDAYPADLLKNYAIPAGNPIPVYNAANPGSPINGLGEMYLTGLRNVSRMSLDRANSDMFMGDVGEVAREELNFLKAGSNTSGPPVDFGWPQHEGMQNSGVPLAPHGPTNPFTGATSVRPIQQFPHTQGGNAIIGGYVYRGNVPSLQGKYFYADFVPGRVWQLDFNRDTDPATFNGNNGTLTDVTALWNAQIVDPTDPTYTAAIGALFGIDHLVSFGEDNAGNLYIVDFGHGTGFDGQYPGAGLGEIFRITFIPEPAAAGALLCAMVLLRRRNM